MGGHSTVRGARLVSWAAPMLAQRLTAQLLAGPVATDPVAVAERLLAIQGQDPRGARLAIRARSTGLRAADVDRALTDERSLLITWLNRGTLHLVRTEDYPWLHALTTPPLFTGNARRLAQEGVDAAAADRGVAAIEDALEREGPQTRDQLVERLRSAGVPSDGQAAIHLLWRASLLGIAVRGPVVGRRHAYVLVRDWIGATAPVDRDRALAELARRFLAGHGPAGDRDLARWAGLPLRDVRAGLAAIAPELAQRPDGLVDLARRPAAAELPAPRLLGAFDPVLLGWVDREPLLGPHGARVIAGGVFRPFALAGGRAVGAWSWSKGEARLEPFGRLGPGVRAALDTDADAVQQFLGPRVKH
jgi:hypothetical protein